MTDKKAFNNTAGNKVQPKKGKPEAHSYINLNLVFDEAEYAPRFGLKVKDNSPPLVLSVLEKLAEKDITKGINVTLDYIGFGKEYYSQDEFEDAELDALLGVRQGVSLEQFAGGNAVVYEPDIFKLYFTVTLDWIKDKNGDSTTVKVESIGVNKYTSRQILSLLLKKQKGESIEIVSEVTSVKDANPNTELTLDKDLMDELGL
jgi:hypothetical protein